MNKIAASVAAITTLVASHALAADMAVKSPAPAPAPVYNWTGWYVGVNAGASMGIAKTDFNVSPVACASSPGICSFNNGHGFSDRPDPSGFIGGGQIGANWQYSPLIVVGVEADIQGALERDSRTLTNSLTDFSCCSVTGVTNYTTEIDWFGTVRARLGYVWGNGQVLSYVTGGLAYGEVKIDGTNAISVSCPPCSHSASGSFSQPFSQSHVNTGWVLGYGTEGAIDFWGAHNWTWRIESLYMDLGHLNATGVFSGCPGNLCATSTPVGFPVSSQIATNTHFTDWILRGGLNYRF
jgi:outer membrane immunogenic protein